MRLVSLVIGFAIATAGAVAFGQANTSLSNLSSTALNADLLPGTTGTINMGNSSLGYLGVYSTCGYFGSGAYIGDCPEVPDSPNGSVTAIGIYHANSHLLFGRETFFVSSNSLFINAGLDDDSVFGNITLHAGRNEDTGVGNDIILQTGGTTSIGTGVVEVNGHLSFNHAPRASNLECTVNAGDASNCRVYYTMDLDNAGDIKVYADGNGIAPGPQAVMTFGQPYAGMPPVCILSPSNPAAGVNAVHAWVESSTTAMTIHFETAAMPGVLYIYNYHCSAVQ